MPSSKPDQPPIQSATLSIHDLAIYIQRSLPSLHRDNAAGRIPRPVKIGGSLRFLRSDIDLWLSLGCPEREEFEARKKSGK